MSEAPASRREMWRRRLRRIRALGRRALPFVSGALMLLVALAIYNALFPPPAPLTQSDVDNSISEAMASATPPPAFSALVYQVIQPSLVLVETKPPGSNSNLFNPGDRAFAGYFTAQDSDQSLGSGVIVDSNGDILTSLHVVAGAGSIEVTFADGTKSVAAVTGTQADNDIAVLQAQTPPAQIVPATLGNPNGLSVGDEAYVVGNPFGLFSSMSAGVISGLERSYQIPGSDQTLQHLIQVDAAVNSGNAGGPLLNRAGQVVGIVTELLNPTGENVFIGIAFAVPITTAGGAAGLPPD